MTSYTVRVELHEADEDDYASLHATMEDEGFVRYISSTDGSKNRLPTAEYNFPNTDLTRADILKRAKEAANAAKPNPTLWIIVTESAGRSWSGLKPWRE